MGRANPLREALNRLSTEELLIGKEQRGFFVKPIGLEEGDAVYSTTTPCGSTK
ncbi:GntR family transcriptional regulator [Agrobacterium vitis]|uniref:GntR family transcriptional regulator n=1 Tax=Agrobacterium vitis TaxID=373 RepID=UPI001F2F14D4|nr:GntR family transcriptional regulator [Agrobacterium vitis]